MAASECMSYGGILGNRFIHCHDRFEHFPPWLCPGTFPVQRFLDARKSSAVATMGLGFENEKSSLSLYAVTSKMKIVWDHSVHSFWSEVYFILEIEKNYLCLMFTLQQLVFLSYAFIQIWSLFYFTITKMALISRLLR